MKRVLPISLICFLFLFACDQSFEVERPAILDEMIDIATAKSINKNNIDWKVFRQKVYDSYEADGRYGAIRTYLRMLEDNHSFYVNTNNQTLNGRTAGFACSESNFAFNNLPEDIAYVRIDGYVGFSDQGSTYARAIQTQIKIQDKENIKGWIIDLSRNTGGNMFPMISGASSFFEDDEILGYFIDPEGNHIQWGVNEGSSYLKDKHNLMTTVSKYPLKNPDAKLAIIVGGETASSGEGTAISFIGKENARLFGERSCGLSTGNEQFQLSDGSLLFITAYTMANRKLEAYGEDIPLDEEFDNEEAMKTRVYEWLLE